jgi:hypothetical protein
MPEPNAPADQAAALALDQISAKVATRGLEIPSKSELCEVYKSVKPLLNDVLPWIEKLPKGKQIADAIRFLETIADAVCG